MRRKRWWKEKWLRKLALDSAAPHRRSGFLALFFLALILLSGCGHRRVVAHSPVTAPPQSEAVPSAQPPAPPAVGTPPGVPGEYMEDGVASWYGEPFHGRRTSNGETYDMYQFTAAHRTLPFGTVVRVTNLDNGKQTEVRINDRGPFVANRIIDLSLSAARALDMVGTGTALVRLEMIAGSNPYVGAFAVQVGAFVIEENAQRLRASLSDRYAPVEISRFESPNGVFYRVRVGRVATQEAAQQLAGQLHADGQATTFVVRLDD